MFQAERRADDDQEKRETKEGWSLSEDGIYSRCARLWAQRVRVKCWHWIQQGSRRIEHSDDWLQPGNPAPADSSRLGIFFYDRETLENPPTPGPTTIRTEPWVLDAIARHIHSHAKT